jgi:hypothetical protein
MPPMDANKMWEIVELVIKENIGEHEAVKCFGHGEVIIDYIEIRDHKPFTNRKALDKATLYLMSVPTLRMFIKEVIGMLRFEATEE